MSRASTGARVRCDGRIPGNDPELGDLFFEIIGKLLNGREISGAKHDPAKVTGIFDMIAMSKTRSGSLCAIWMMPRALAIGSLPRVPGEGGDRGSWGGPRFCALVRWFFHVVFHTVFHAVLSPFLFFRVSPGPL